MKGRRTPDGVHVGGDARQRLHDARGYGHPVANGELRLTPVEAAHLLYRGELTTVDGMAFPEFVASVADRSFAARFAVFADLRDRGFYVDPVDRPTAPEMPAQASYVVYERGAGRNSSAVAFPVRTVGEYERIDLGGLEPMVIAVADSEGEIGYVDVDHTTLSGDVDPPASGPADAAIVGDRVYVWDPPSSLYREWFFGRPIGGRTANGDPLAVSLVEAAYLAGEDHLSLSADAVRERGRALHGDRFDRLVRAYRTLRANGTVPKTGYKFGTDFRVYTSFAGLDALSHSEQLVRVVRPTATVRPAALSLDVRLATGVGKRMVFAITPATPDTASTWLSVARLTP